jgi:predicted aspartyl protease
MGAVTVEATVQNVADVYNATTGQLAPEKIRSIKVNDALVDTGATMLGLPQRFIKELGLIPVRERRARTPAGPATFNIFGTVRLTIQDRMTNCDVVEQTDDCPTLIGQIPLEGLDFLVDPISRKLIGNPSHNGEQMIDLF